MSYFDDVFKSTKDFFKKSFNYDSKVEVKASGANSVNFTTEAGINSSKAAFASLKAERKTGDISVDTVKVATDGKLNVDFSFPNFVPSNKVTFKLEDGTRTSSANTSAVFGIEGKVDIGAATGYKVDVDAVGGAVNASALANYDGVLLGGKVALATPIGGADGVSVTNHAGVIGYRSGATTVGAQFDNNCADATAFFYTKSGAYDVTGKAGFSLNGGKGVSVAVGAKTQVNGATVYGAVNHKASVDVGYETSVGSNSTLGVFANVNALDIASDSHKLGLNLKIRA